jgi:sugar phosphate isomerase/epimerase
LLTAGGEGIVKGLGKVRAGAALAVTGAALTLATPAQAQRPPTLGNGAPSGQSGIQLYNFNNYLSNGAGEITCPAPPAAPTPYCVNPPAPTTSAGRLERVFQFLQARGIKNVELYGYPGNPFPSGNNPNGDIAGLQALRALGDQYGLRFPARHGSFDRWDAEINAAKILGQDHVGSSGLPTGFNANTTYAQVLQNVAILNDRGKRSVEQGLGPAYFHNHQPEFAIRFMDNGVLKSGWEIIMERTDPRWVIAQIDIGWAVCGAAGSEANRAAGEAYVTNMINRFQTRVISFHVKDLVNARLTCGNNDQRTLGLGEINFVPMFAAAANRVKYYFAERDPVGIGGATNFNPFNNTADSATNLRGNPIGVAKAAPQQFSAVPAGTAAADNVKPVVVTNDGDGPLVFTNAGPTISAHALDVGSAADFAVVSQNCSGMTLQPGGSCTINVGFKPTRTNWTSVATLQFASNSDNAVERVLLAGTSTGESLNNVSADVPSLLSLNIAPSATFGSFVPAVARNYDTALAGAVTSTAGDATLSVYDASASNVGVMTNGTFALSSPLQIRAAHAGNPSAALAPITGTAAAPQSIATWAAPTFGAETVTLNLRQAISATEQLRAGSYGKTLTFTLSTTTP